MRKTKGDNIRTSDTTYIQRVINIGVKIGAINNKLNPFCDSESAECMMFMTFHSFYFQVTASISLVGLFSSAQISSTGFFK